MHVFGQWEEPTLAQGERPQAASGFKPRTPLL